MHYSQTLYKLKSESEMKTKVCVCFELLFWEKCCPFLLACFCLVFAKTYNYASFSLMSKDYNLVSQSSIVYGPLIVTSFISYIRGKSSPQILIHMHGDCDNNADIHSEHCLLD